MRKTLIAGLTAGLLVAAAPARAATFDVTKAADGADGTCDADCSLREAVKAANDAAGPDTITLHAETYSLTLGQLDLADAVTIAGAGADRSVLDAGGASRVFQVAGGADARISGVTIRHGRTSAAGAGILNLGTLALTDAVVADNHAVGGGGVHNLGTATLSGVTLSGNSGAEAAAALSNHGSMTVTNSTVTGSVTGAEGVSVAGDDGTLALRNVTLAPTTGFVLGRYFAGQVTLVNTIVDGACEGTPTSLGHNLESGDTCGLEQADSDPQLEPLAGAPVPVHGLAAGSPAIDAGDDAACPATDQRGVARPQGAHCDIGAVEAATIVIPGPRPRRGTVYVTERSAGTATAFDAATGTSRWTSQTGASPIGIVRPRGVDKVYTSDEGSNQMSVLDRLTGTRLGTIPMGPAPHHLMASGDGRRIYVGEFGSSRIGVVDTRSDRRIAGFIASTVPEARTHAVYVRGRDLYATNTRVDRSQPGDVAKLDARTGALKCNVGVGADPSEILIAPGGRVGYVSVRREDKIKELDLRGRCPVLTGREAVIGTQPDTLQLTPDRRTLVVTLRGTPAQISLMDTRTFAVRKVGIPGHTTTGHHWLSPRGRFTYVAAESPGSLVVVDNRTGTVVADYPYPGGPRPHGVYAER